MRVSVVTPAGDARHLDSCYESLLRQTYTDWEWIVMLHSGAADWGPREPDERVLVSRHVAALGAGAAKRFALERTAGELLVELDQGGELASTCLERVVDAFVDHPEAGLVYSDHALINEDGSANEEMSDPAQGWQYSEETVDGRSVLRCLAMEPFPHNVSWYWFAPQHFRALRRTTYETIGGYDATEKILVEHDLTCRMYEEAAFFHVPECLYLQRVRSAVTESRLVTDRLTEQQAVAHYDVYVQRLALSWARREGLHCLDMGAAHNKPEGYLGVDQYAGPSVDIVADVTEGIDLPDGSVGVIRAVDFLEHVPDKIAIFNELYRLLSHGGMLLSLTPSTDGRGAFQDPTHVAYYNENSFWYFTEREYALFVPQITCQFQVSTMVTEFMSPWHREHQISYVNANLVALKGGSRQGGICNW